MPKKKKGAARKPQAAAREPEPEPEPAAGAGAGASKGIKVKPNAPCPCGSGKKYKKCCQLADSVAKAKPATKPAWAWRGDPDAAVRLSARLKKAAALRDGGDPEGSLGELQGALADAQRIGHTQAESAVEGRRAPPALPALAAPH